MNTNYNREGNYILAVCPNPSVDIFAWIDSFTQGNVNRLRKEEHFPGGKGVHVALACAELGEEVRLLGFWGGPTGSWIKNECEKYPNLKCIGIGVGEWSRSCYTFKSESEFDETEVLGVGPTITYEEMEMFVSSFEDYVPEAKCVVMSGSWPKGTPQNGYASLIGIANSHNKATILDCTGNHFTEAMRLNPYAIHLNRKEVETIYNVDHFDKAESQMLEHCEVAAITDGAKGLYLYNKEQNVHADCRISGVHSAVGSGDCLTAGIAIGFVRGQSHAESAQLGVACGAANCLREELGMLHQYDVEVMLERAQSRIIETVSA